VTRPKEVSDAEIIKAARKVFLERGTQTPVTEVAKELGVSSATLFLRMGSKDNLVTAALWPPDPPVMKRLDEGVRQGEPVDDQLLSIVYELADYVAAEIAATFLLYAGGRRPRPGEDFSEVTPMVLRRKLARWLTEAAGAGRRSGPKPEIAAELIMGTLEARNLHAFITKKPISTRASRAFIRDVVAAIFRSPDGASSTPA
jgi:AcrR family transcriptional regulator